MSEIRFMTSADYDQHTRSAWDDVLSAVWLHTPPPQTTHNRTRLIRARHRAHLAYARRAGTNPRAYATAATTRREE